MAFGMWLSPGAAWFIFFNVVVGAIAVMSWVGQGGHAPSTRRGRLARTASIVVMERLRSFSMFPFQYSAADYSLTPLYSTVSDSDYCSQEAEEVHQVCRVLEEPEPLKRPELSEPVAMGETRLMATMAAPTAPVAAAAAPADAVALETEEEEPFSLDEAYALARQGHAPHSRGPAAAADPVAWPPAKVAEDVKRRAYAFSCGREAEEVEGKAELNARADQFIRQFREDLKLERLNSIINYTNALRPRGVGAAPAPAR